MRVTMTIDNLKGGKTVVTGGNGSNARVAIAGAFGAYEAERKRGADRPTLAALLKKGGVINVTLRMEYE